jgi:hypothetical protein
MARSKLIRPRPCACAVATLSSARACSAIFVPSLRWAAMPYASHVSSVVRRHAVYRRWSRSRSGSGRDCRDESGSSRQAEAGKDRRRVSERRREFAGRRCLFLQSGKRVRGKPMGSACQMPEPDLLSTSNPALNDRGVYEPIEPERAKLAALLHCEADEVEGVTPGDGMAGTSQDQPATRTAPRTGEQMPCA